MPGLALKCKGQKQAWFFYYAWEAEPAKYETLMGGVNPYIKAPKVRRATQKFTIKYLLGGDKGSEKTEKKLGSGIFIPKLFERVIFAPSVTLRKAWTLA